MSDDETLQRIETLLAHHERQIQDLSDIIAAQSKEILFLKARLQKTNEKLADIEASSGDSAQKEGLSVTEQALADKPPHY